MCLKRASLPFIRAGHPARQTVLISQKVLRAVEHSGRVSEGLVHGVGASLTVPYLYNCSTIYGLDLKKEKSAHL